MTYKKKLIEVALPLEAINKARRRRKIHSPRASFTLHLVGQAATGGGAGCDLCSNGGRSISTSRFISTVKKQDKERQRLFRIIEDLVLWKSTTNEAVLQKARDEIWASWRRTCAENADHPQAKNFDRYKTARFFESFCQWGALPLEANWLDWKHMPVI